MPSRIDPERLARIRAHVLAAAALVSTEGCDRVRGMLGMERPEQIHINPPPPSMTPQPPEVRHTVNDMPPPPAPDVVAPPTINPPMPTPAPQAPSQKTQGEN